MFRIEWSVHGHPGSLRDRRQDGPAAIDAIQPPPSADAVLRLSAPTLPDWGKSYIGASGRKDDWPEQWTVSGLESLYDLRERSEHEN